MVALSPARQKFILHWGEMGPKWGVNRSVAQIHALLFLSKEPLTAEEIADALSLARSNVSTSLKELLGWRIVRLVHVMGDRRDHFESLQDVWEMFQIVLDERKRREIDPTTRLLRECIEQAGSDAHVKARLEAMLGFFEAMSSWYQQVRRLPQAAMIRFVKMGRKVQKLLGVTS
ncbi:MAG: MarR family transcriptional regulator [Planctomycetes bacterium]|nr:MarR family transcriptional regulator [Planctomycetota bacterium]